MKIIRLIVLVAALAFGAFLYLQIDDITIPDNDTALGPPIVSVTLPPLTDVEKSGAETYAQHCRACHGANASGQEGVAPPLVHKIYEPGHHGDEAFQMAVQMGVRAHHWPFGNMPPISGLSREDVTPLITYIRALQRANGIK